MKFSCVLLVVGLFWRYDQHCLGAGSPSLKFFLNNKLWTQETFLVTVVYMIDVFLCYNNNSNNSNNNLCFRGNGSGVLMTYHIRSIVLQVLHTMVMLRVQWHFEWLWIFICWLSISGCVLLISIATANFRCSIVGIRSSISLHLLKQCFSCLFLNPADPMLLAV